MHEVVVAGVEGLLEGGHEVPHEDEPVLGVLAHHVGRGGVGAVVERALALAAENNILCTEFFSEKHE